MSLWVNILFFITLLNVPYSLELVRQELFSASKIKNLVLNNSRWFTKQIIMEPSLTSTVVKMSRLRPKWVAYVALAFKTLLYSRTRAKAEFVYHVVIINGWEFPLCTVAKTVNVTGTADLATEVWIVRSNYSVSSLSLCRSALSVATIGTADRRVRSESVGQYSVSCVSERSGTYGPGWLPPVRFYVWFYFLHYSQFLFILLLSKTAKVRLDFKLIFSSIIV